MQILNFCSQAAKCLRTFHMLNQSVGLIVEIEITRQQKMQDLCSYLSVPNRDELVLLLFLCDNTVDSGTFCPLSFVKPCAT